MTTRPIHKLAVLLLAALGGFLFVRWMEGSPAEQQVAPSADQGPDGAPGDASEGGSPDVAAPSTLPIPARTLVPVDGEDGPPTLTYQVVDGLSGAPIAGAVVRRANDAGERASDLGRTDVEGLLVLAAGGGQLGGLLFLADGYLPAVFALGTFAHDQIERASTRNGRLRVPLWPDDRMVAMRFRFTVVEPAEPPTQVQMWLTPLAEPPPTIGSLPGGAPGDALAAQAWQRFTHAAMLPAAGALGYHFGIQSSHTVFQVAAEAELRFVAEGPYLLEAIDAVGRRASQVVHVVRDGSVEAPLCASRSVELLVVGEDIPLAGAVLHPAEPLLGVHPVTTDANGLVRLSHLPVGPVRLLCTHPHATQDTVVEVPVQLPVGPLRITLPLRAARSLHGGVSARNGAVLAEAQVHLEADGAVVASTRVSADGRFTLVTRHEEPLLVVKAHGYLTWKEAVAEDAPYLAVSLVPATQEARVGAALSTVVRGVVRGPDHTVRKNQIVQIQMEGHGQMPGIAGRRILEGWMLPEVPLTTTDAEGRFVLEVTRAGPAQLLAVDGLTSEEDALRLEILLGNFLEGFELRTRR